MAAPAATRANRNARTGKRPRVVADDDGHVGEEVPVAPPVTSVPMDTAIVIETAPITGIPVTLGDGHEYTLIPPKAALAMRLAVQVQQAKDDPSLILDMMDDWLARGFGKKQMKEIQTRLDDPEDPLDITHLMELMETVIERQSGTPIT